MDVVAPAAPPASSPRAPEPPPAVPPPSAPPPPSEPAPASPANVIAFPGSCVGRGRICACCSSPWRREIDQRLAAGQSARAIEAILAPGDPSADSVQHHARRCIPHLLGEHAAELRAEVLTTVRGRVEALLGRAEKLVEDAEGGAGLCKACGEEAGAALPRDRTATITAAKGVLELLARILGKLGAEVDVRLVLDSPRFAAEKAAIIKALLPYPEAAAAVVAALRALDG